MDKKVMKIAGVVCMVVVTMIFMLTRFSAMPGFAGQYMSMILIMPIALILPLIIQQKYKQNLNTIKQKLAEFGFSTTHVFGDFLLDAHNNKWYIKRGMHMPDIRSLSEIDSFECYAGTQLLISYAGKRAELVFHKPKITDRHCAFLLKLVLVDKQVASIKVRGYSSSRKTSALNALVQKSEEMCTLLRGLLLPIAPLPDKRCPYCKSSNAADSRECASCGYKF